MAELKTKLNNASVNKFLNKISDPKTRQDCFTISELMQKITKAEPKMWGSSIVGFGKYHYKYASGHEGDMCITGFSPRKQYLTLYIGCDFNNYDELMEKLGKHKRGKACLYFKSLDDIEIKVLKKIISESVKYYSKKHLS